MDQVFPYANIVAGVLVLIVGFGFHWLGQLVCVINWEVATKLGIAEKGLKPEYKAYEHAIAVADVALGWIYGIAGIALIIDAQLGYKLAWFPGVVMIYHSITFWFLTANRRKAGHQYTTDSVRITWFLMNFVTGVLAVLVAWNASC
jgi:hypothetical protein